MNGTGWVCYVVGIVGDVESGTASGSVVYASAGGEWCKWASDRCAVGSGANSLKS